MHAISIGFIWKLMGVYFWKKMASKKLQMVYWNFRKHVAPWADLRYSNIIIHGSRLELIIKKRTATKKLQVICYSFRKSISMICTFIFILLIVFQWDYICLKWKRSLYEVVQILILFAALDTVHAFLFDKLPGSVVAC